MPGRCHHVVIGAGWDAWFHSLPTRECEYGNCYEWYCVECGAGHGGFGPADCPCDDMRVFPEQRKVANPIPLKPYHARLHRRRKR